MRLFTPRLVILICTADCKQQRTSVSRFAITISLLAALALPVYLAVEVNVML